MKDMEGDLGMVPSSDNRQEFTLDCTLQNIVTKWSDDILRWQDDGGCA